MSSHSKRQRENTTHHPTNIPGESGVDSTRCNEYAGIDQAGQVAMGTGCDGYDEADEDGTHWNENIRRSANF